MTKSELMERIGARAGDMAYYCINDILDAETEEDFRDEQIYLNYELRLEARRLIQMADEVNKLKWEDIK